jgi:hypothetical protein
MFSRVWAWSEDGPGEDGIGLVPIDRSENFDRVREGWGAMKAGDVEDGEQIKAKDTARTQLVMVWILEDAYLDR